MTTGARRPGSTEYDSASGEVDEARWQGQIDALHATERKEHLVRVALIYDNDKPTRVERERG